MADHNVKLDPNQTLGVLSEVGEIVPSPLQPATSSKNHHTWGRSPNQIPNSQKAL